MHRSHNAKVIGDFEESCVLSNKSYVFEEENTEMIEPETASISNQ